jgi:hypothetical protein
MATATGQNNLIDIAGGKVPRDAATIVALTDSTSGTANDTVAAVADIALSTTDTYTDAAVNSAVNTAIASIEDGLADCAAKINEILTLLQNMGLRN